MVEYRYSQNKAELRVNESNDSRHVTGYALNFNSLSQDLGGFREIILPGALEGVIEKSDILALLDHNRDRGVLARSTFGEGSLKLTVDEIGLKYEFDAPNTALGEELIEGLKRNDIRNSSFGFTVKEDYFEKQEDGTIVRKIVKFDELFDVSPVWHPAYSTTTVDLRSYEKFIEEEDMTKKQKRSVDELLKEISSLKSEIEELRSNSNNSSEEKEEKEDTSNTSEEEKIEENSCEKEEERSEEDTEKKEESIEKSSEEEKEEKESEEDTRSESEEEKEEQKEENSCNSETEEKRSVEPEPDSTTNQVKNIQIRNININMSNKFSLTRALNDYVNGKNMSEETQKVHEAGLQELRKSNLNAPGNSLVLPLNYGEIESRNVLQATVPADGGNAVPSDWLGIYAGLREALVLSRLGARILPNLSGNLVLPSYTNSKATWKGEIDKADDGAGTFPTPKEMSPKRLVCKVEVSRQALLQTESVGVEAMLRQDITEAIAYALEKQLFSSDAGTPGIKPAGLFNGVVADSNPATFEDFVEMEQLLKHDNIPSNFKYLMSTSAESITRTTRIDAGSGLMLQQGNTINGIPVISSGIVEDRGVILGNFNELFVGLWQGLTMTIDSTTRADEDIIRLICVTYVDAITRRDNAFVKKILA